MPLIKHRQKLPTNANELNTSALVELLQQSAAEHLMEFLQLEDRKFSHRATICSPDYEALYAYKCGDYQRCLHLSAKKFLVRTRYINANCDPDILKFPQFIQLMDDDIVSLTALMLIVEPGCRDNPNDVGISQLTLLLYLITQCQLKLRHTTDVARTLRCIEEAKTTRPVAMTLNHLVLKFLERKGTIYLTSNM